MSMFNDISWVSKDNKKECELIAQLVCLFARRFGAGQWSSFGEKVVLYWWRQSTKSMGQNGGKDDGDTRRKRTSSLLSHESTVQRSAWKQNGGKLSIHHCADQETITTVFRTITSVNQLSLYGTVAEMCEEYESFHAGRPAEGEQSSSSFVPNVINTNVPLNNDDPVQRYGKRIEKLSQQDRLSEFLYGCRIPDCCWSRTVFHDERHWRILTIHRCSGLSWIHTLPGIRGITKIGPVLEVTTCCLQDEYGVQIRIVSEQWQFSLMGQNFSWPKQVGHELEQQRARNLCNVVRKICVKIECGWFCKPIKGKSKTTETRFCQLINKNHTYLGENLDWCRTRKAIANQLFNVDEIDPSSSSWKPTLKHWWSDWILENKR